MFTNTLIHQKILQAVKLALIVLARVFAVTSQLINGVGISSNLYYVGYSQRNAWKF